jgi:hypothetical protein
MIFVPFTKNTLKRCASTYWQDGQGFHLFGNIFKVKPLIFPQPETEYLFSYGIA